MVPWRARALLGLRPPFTLCLDRTQWQDGGQHPGAGDRRQAGAGAASVAHDRWRGPSDTEARIALIRRFCDLFGKEAIALLVADREFIGAQWFDFLVETDIPFVISVK